MTSPPATITSDPENGLTWRRADLFMWEIHLKERASSSGSHNVALGQTPIALATA